MNFLRLFFLTACIATISVVAQDLGPIKVDLEGYIDDSKNELLTAEEPVKEEPKKEEVKPEEAKKVEGGPRRRRTTASSEKTEKVPTPVATEKKPITKVDLNSFKTQKDDPMMMYMIIGGAVLLLIIIIVVVVMLKKKAANKRKSRSTEDDNISLSEKIEAHEEAVAAETTEDQQPVVTPYAEGEEHLTPTTTKEMADQFARETALNEKGQNSSGIIIDEDKYFGGGNNFVDEDFSDMDGPHDGAPPADPGEAPNLPPG